MSKNTGIIAVLHRELLLLRSRKSFLIGMVCLPVLSLIFFLTLFGKSELHDLPLAVVDNDNSTISRQFIQMIDASAGVEVKYSAGSMYEAQKLVYLNKVDGVLYIPAGMQKDIYSAAQVKPLILTNSVRLLNSTLVYKDVATVSQMLSAGIEMQLLTSEGKTDMQAYNLALPVYYEKHLMFNPYSSYGYYLETPFNFLIILLFATLSTLFTVGLERKKQTADQWLERAGGDPYVAILGKMLPYTIFYSLFAIISNFIIYGILLTPIAGSLTLLAINCVICIIVYQMVGLIIYAIIGKLMESMSISAAITTMSFTMSGLTFPLIAMYKPIFYLAHLFPFTYFMYAYIDIIRGADTMLTISHIAIMIIYIVIGILIIPKVVRLTQIPIIENFDYITSNTK